MYDSNEIVIGIPVSPARRVSCDEVDGFEVMVSCGGGMGGSKMKYYTTEVKKKAGNSIVKIKTIDNRQLELTDRFIVHIEPVRLVKAVFDTTAHTNYRETVCKKAIQTCWYCFRGNEHYSLSSQIQHSFDSKCGKIEKWRVIREIVHS
jgi:hypothetical protein